MWYTNSVDENVAIYEAASMLCIAIFDYIFFSCAININQPLALCFNSLVMCR